MSKMRESGQSALLGKFGGRGQRHGSSHCDGKGLTLRRNAMKRGGRRGVEVWDWKWNVKGGKRRRSESFGPRFCDAGDTAHGENRGLWQEREELFGG